MNISGYLLKMELSLMRNTYCEFYIQPLPGLMPGLFNNPEFYSGLFGFKPFGLIRANGSQFFTNKEVTLS